jgi:hypothetical protein
MDEAVEDGVGDRGIANDLVPAIDRHLTGDHDRPGVVAVLDDFEKIAALLGAVSTGTEVSLNVGA